MKRKFGMLVIITAIIAAAIALAILWQHDNISALINGLNNSTDELAQKMDENRNNLKAEVEKYISEPITDITAEDEKKLIKGEITVEEVADKYKLPLDYMKDSDTADNEAQDDGTGNTQSSSPANSTSAEQPNSKTIDKAISEGVSRMYALKAKYVSRLGEVEKTVLEEYKNLPEDKQNKDGKYKILMENIDYVAQLEKKCDDEVANVLSNLEKELKELNGDTEIVKILKDAYKQEKELKKSFYLSIYSN